MWSWRLAHRAKTRIIARGGSEIRGQSVDFPIAVARWLGSVAAGNFRGAIGRMAIRLGPACRRLSQGALSRRRQRALGERAILRFRGRGRFGGGVGGRHTFQLAHSRLACKRPRSGIEARPWMASEDAPAPPPPGRAAPRPAPPAAAT